MNGMRSTSTVTLWLLMTLGLSGLGVDARVAAQAPADKSNAEASRSPEPEQGAKPEHKLYAYTLRHQPARDAFEVVQRMLSPDGKISLRSSSRTLEIRDTPEILRQVGAFLRSFDHPPLTLELELLVVRAVSLPVSPQPADSPEIPRELISEWRKILRFKSYQLLARAELEPQENEEVTYEMADGYRVSFRLGTLLANRRIKLHSLRLTRTRDAEEEVLIHSTLNPWIGRPTALGIPQGEDSRSALMLVVICHSPKLWAEGTSPIRDGGSPGGR